jgi:hypothetical protein
MYACVRVCPTTEECLLICFRIVPDTAHAAFSKASNYFGIKLHVVPCPAPDYKVHIPTVRRLINPNTVLLVASAPNFPHGMVDDIPALSRLAVSYKIPLHVDCCLGSFVIAFLKRAGYPSPYEDEGGFDFRQPGVTSISVDTHKYAFAPKGNSVVLYRNRTLRSYQYFIMPNWSGGVYASPSMAGSRPGSLIAGCWASLMAMGESGYKDSCHKIISASRKFEESIREHPVLSKSLKVVGKPMVSVVAFTSSRSDIDIYFKTRRQFMSLSPSLPPLLSITSLPTCSHSWKERRQKPTSANEPASNLTDAEVTPPLSMVSPGAFQTRVSSADLLKDSLIPSISPKSSSPTLDILSLFSWASAAFHLVWTGLGKPWCIGTEYS